MSETGEIEVIKGDRHMASNNYNVCILTCQFNFFNLT